MADVIRRNPLGTEERHFAGEDRHRADEIHIHHRPQKRSWWPFALLALLAVGLLALWSYTRRHRMDAETRAPVERISPALPAPPPNERPAAPQAPIVAPLGEEEHEATEPDTGAAAPQAPEEQAKPERATPQQAEPGTEAEPGAAAGTTGGCSEQFSFDANETSLDAENDRTLKSLANCLKSDPSITAIVIEGRADPRGSAEYNEGLARGRAQSVSDGLIALGVPSEQVTIGIGEPLCSETTQECMQKNRSVTATAKR